MKASALTIVRADSFLARLGGLLARPPLSADEALYLTPCASVHTFFMRYSIDVAFVDGGGRVLKLVQHLRPFRVASCWRACGAVELMAGEAARHGIGPGSSLTAGLAKGSRL